MTKPALTRKPPRVWSSPEARARSIKAPRFADGKRWRGKLRIPTKCHPLVRRLFILMNEQNAQIQEVADESGVSRSTFWSWGHTRMPGVDKLEAALNTLGFRLKIEPMPDISPAPLTEFNGFTPGERRVASYMNGNGPLSVAHIADATGYTKSTVEVMMVKLRRRGFNIPRSGEWGEPRYEFTGAKTAA